MDVTSFFNKLSLIWQEMSLCRDPTNGLQYSRIEKVDRIYDFLTGLNPKFDVVRGHILGKRPIPSLMEVCSEICLEEDRTSAMNISTTPSIDSVAFTARSSTSGNDKHNGKPIPIREPCKQQWHTKEQCSKLHGRPLGDKKRPSNDKQNTGRTYVSEFVGPSQPPESQGNQIDHGPTTLGVIVQSGIPQSSSLICVNGKNPWILDSGTTDHLTRSSKHFVSYIPCASNGTIRIAYGSLAPIAGKRKISPCAGLFLNNVLHFGKMIGTAQHSRGLYLLNDDTSSSSTSRTSLLSSYFTTSEQDCMLLHFHLGHPNFQYMKHLFPHLFSKIDVSTLSCDVCIRTKQHRVSFPSQPYKPTHPFTLVHSDIWGPSKITTSSRKRWFVTFIDDHTRLTWVFLVSDKSEVTSVF
ncbi:hypothetical protein IC582_006047 [Cucumis melo]